MPMDHRARRWPLAILVAGALALAGATTAARAQFADDTQGLFDTSPKPKPKDDIVIMEFSTAPDANQTVAPENAGAQSVEDICCQESPDQRKTDGLCFDVQCPDSASAASQSQQQ